MTANSTRIPSDHQRRGRQSDHARHADGKQQVQVGEGHREFHRPPLCRPWVAGVSSIGRAPVPATRCICAFICALTHCKKSCYSSRLGCLLPLRGWPMCWCQYIPAPIALDSAPKACAADCHSAWHRLRSPAWIHITPQGPPPHLADQLSARPAHSPACPFLQPVCRNRPYPIGADAP
jgi:hypothetical protein